MIVLRSAAFGCALALGATGAYAQNVISRQIDNEPVETTVTQTPGGTVITRRPVAAAPIVPAAPLYAPAPPVTAVDTTTVDETVGVAPSVRPVRRPAARISAATRVVRHTHNTTTRTVTRTVRAAAPPLVLAPAQRQVVYRTIVQQQVVPVAPAGYPAFPPPAYRPRTVVVAPSATTGYGITQPAADMDDDDVVVEQVPAEPVYRTRYGVGSVLPANVVLTPMPATAAVEVPSVQPYSYTTLDGRVLLVDPATNAVVADITP